MRDDSTIKNAVERARRRHEQLAHDRLFGEGRLGDHELTELLEVPYPTLVGQHN